MLATKPASSILFVLMEQELQVAMVAGLVPILRDEGCNRTHLYNSCPAGLDDEDLGH